MASLNTSSNGPAIAKSHKSILDAPLPTGQAGASATYGQWAVYSVSAPLVNAFQQDSASKESVLKVQSTGGQSNRKAIKHRAFRHGWLISRLDRGRTG
jgi:hypothetical protein